MRYFLLTMWALFATTAANYPVFEGAGQLKELLIPADVHIGSVIYRLRASDSDHDYPLQFDATDYGSYVVKVENLPCNVNSTYCEANVYLERVLMVGQVFKFRFTVRDTKGDTTTASVSIEVTDAPVDITTIFPHLPGIIILPENTKPGTELEYVIVRRHPEHKKPALLEIRGSSVVDFGRMRSSQETTTGVITLKKSLDFEQQNMYKLQIFALDMYTDKLVDSRNIAGFEIILIVEDVQDTPPIFINTEPTVKLRSNMTQGDIITKVTAIDGDKGNPRPINYGLVSENNPFTIFFNIDRMTGLVTLIKPLKQLTAIARSHQPILLTIMAEEERANMKEPPALSTTATIALLLAEAGNTPPYFDNDHYVCHLNENSPQGAALLFSDAYSTQVHDDDMGKQGVFSLILEKNNGTFEISPNVVERKAYFTIRVRNNLLLDYESRKSVEFVIVARELDPGSLSSSVTVLVYLNDVNDNPPQFQRTVYMSQIPENTTANAYVTEVKASDIDTGLSGRVHYTRILGFRNSSLLLNSVTGVITVASDNHGFDREEASEYHLTVEARDMEGVGLLATVPLIVRILDVNDETPVFENAPFHFTLTSDLRNFSTRAFIKAADKDAEPPNNIVRYEIISGNYNNKFILNSETGELTVRNIDALTIRKRRQASSGSNNVYTLTVRAYDLGVPHRWSTAQVRIFPPDTGTRLLTFIMPAKGLDYEKMEELLIKITGGQVTIVEIKPYHSHRYSRAVADSRKSVKEKSTVVARVTYGDNSMIDVEHVYYLLQSIYYNGPPENDHIHYQTAESGMSTFWILLLLLLLLIAICIALLLCYLLKCHPCCTWFSNKKKIQVSDAAQTVNLHNKGVQANNHRSDTRSSTDSGHRNRWKFYRRREHEAQPIFLVQKNASPIHYRNTATNEEMPTFVYRGDIPSVDRHGDLYIQDIADSEYHILDPSKLNVQRLGEQENVSRTKKYNGRATLERKRRQISPSSREETFVREGQAEILRLQTNDDSTAEEILLHQPDKNYYNHFETNNTSKTSSSHTADTAKKYEANKNTVVTHLDHSALQKQFAQASEGDETPTRQKPKLHRSKHFTDSVESQPNEFPNQTKHFESMESTHSIADQAVHVVNIESSQHPADRYEQKQSVHVGNIESLHHLADQSLRDNQVTNQDDVTNIETSHHPADQPIQEIQVVNLDSSYHPTANYPEVEPSFIPISKNSAEKLASGVSKVGVINYIRPKPNTDDTQPSVEPETFRNLLSISHLEEERNKLTTFQRDLLLTRFLVEEQRRFLTQTVDTQSLPGSLSMGTQTDRHRSTQTDLLCLMRPEPRKVKSENDDSSDSEIDCVYKKGKGYRRCYSVIGKDTARYKIRTPIIEESENLEGTRQVVLSHRQNKSSLLRMANNRHKINTREALVEAKSRLDLKHGKIKYKSSNDLDDAAKTHVSLRDSKKSMSYVDINDPRNVLSDKEIYTPRSLKSRLIARRLSASEPPKLGAHCMSHFYQDVRDRQKAIDKDPLAAEWCKMCNERKKRGADKVKCKHDKSNSNAKDKDKQSSSSSNTSTGTKSIEPAENHRTVLPPITGTCTLKLKSKHQSLMEKKSVFTIAYDDAATQHIGGSSNGSVQE